jgi:hypothetical protein
MHSGTVRVPVPDPPPGVPVRLQVEPVPDPPCLRQTPSLSRGVRGAPFGKRKAPASYDTGAKYQTRFAFSTLHQSGEGAGDHCQDTGWPRKAGRRRRARHGPRWTPSYVRAMATKDETAVYDPLYVVFQRPSKATVRMRAIIIRTGNRYTFEICSERAFPSSASGCLSYAPGILSRTGETDVQGPAATGCPRG